MLTLYSFGPKLGLHDPSPFVYKVDAYLRMADVAFGVNDHPSNLQKAPKGKLPFLHDDNKEIADSYFIVEYLKSEKQIDLDHWLSEHDKALVHLITKSLDENLYWCLVYSRWVNEDTWPRLRHAFFASLPFFLRPVIPYLVRKGVLSALNKHGLGRHSNAEMLKIASHSLHSLSIILGDKAYFMGSQPCSLDAAAYGLLSQMILSEIDNPLNRLARSFDNLVAYCNRLHLAYYHQANIETVK